MNKKYEVRLYVPTSMWATIEVEANSEEQAKEIALAQNSKGSVSYSFAGFDTSDAEIEHVEEIE